MDVDASSPGNDEATPEQEPETQPEEGTAQVPEDRSWFSVTARWRKYESQFEALKEAILQWCRKDSPEMQDLAFPEHSAAASKCCDKCTAVVELKAEAESFLTCKAAHARAEKDLVDTGKLNKEDANAEKEHGKGKKKDADAGKEHVEGKEEDADAEKKLLQATTEHADAEQKLQAAKLSSENSEMLELLTQLVAAKEALVAKSATIVALKEDLGAVKEDLVFEKAGSLAKSATIVTDKADRLAHGVRFTCKCHDGIRSLLAPLSAASNDTSLLTVESGEAPSTAGLDEPRFDAESPPSPSKFDELCKPRPLESGNLKLRQCLDHRQMQALKPFYEHLQNIFRNASMLVVKKGKKFGEVERKKYRKNIEVTVNGIMDWNIGNHVIPIGSGFYIPGNVGQETIGVQPILYAIMVKMAEVLGLESRITNALRIRKEGNRPYRIVDSVVTNPEEEHLFAILPAMLGVPIEVKPITRTNTTADKLLAEAENQVVGHLAKRAMYSFDFGGIGENCTVFGLALNMATITVVGLELSGVGTDKVDLTTQRTRRMPLFDKATRGQLFGDKATDGENALEEKTEEMLEGMSVGFCLLARMLVSVHAAVGASLNTSNNDRRHCFVMHADDAESMELGDPLGSGAFSHVYKLIQKDKGDMFVKVPKSYRLKNSLIIEAAALQVLSENDYIPKLCDTKNPIKTLHIKIRCESSTIPCLPLRGLIGRPTSRQQRWKRSGLENIAVKVYKALKYANDKGWAHLDVRPSNIITHDEEVMLIDWGCARSIHDKLTRFVGCPPYAHDDLFSQPTKLVPCLDHDLASLAYTLACLHHGRIPWAGDFPNHLPVSDGVKKKRFKITCNVLKSLLNNDDPESKEVKQALSNAITCEEIKNTKRKSGNVLEGLTKLIRL